MDNQEAKFILAAYRPGGADAGDARFAEALAQARRDPELARWFEQEQALDRVVAQKLRSVAPPAGLRDSIVAGARVSKPRRSAWQRAPWLALAASLVLVLGAGLFFARQSKHGELDAVVAGVYQDMINGAHDSTGSDAARLVAFLEQPSTRVASDALPIDPLQLKKTGCRSLSVAGRDILEVCFARSGKEFHLYVMTGGSNFSSSPRVMARDGVQMAAWRDQRFAYVLATGDGGALLKGLL